MRFPIVLLLLLTVIPAAGFGQERLRLHGSNTIGERLAPELASGWLRAEGFDDIRRVAVAFEEIELHARRGEQMRIVEIHAHGSSTGFKGLGSGATDIAMSSRPTTPADAGAQVGRLDSPGQEVVLALDGLAIIVHPGNPLRELSKAQVRAIFKRKNRELVRAGRPSRSDGATRAR